MIRQRDGQLLADSLLELPAILDALNCRRVLLVLDRGASRASGADRLLPDLLGSRLAGVFDDFSPNPVCSQPLAAARCALDLGADSMLAFGGGSGMDVAKVGALAAGTPAHAEQLVHGVYLEGATPLPIVAIPTTSGTGSEATHFSAVYVDGRKISVAHHAMRPRGVVLDPDLHATMPAFVAATTGLDALCQATESIWAVGATDASIEHAIAAQAVLTKHLVSSVRRAERTDRERVMWGAHWAGQAINISKTTASHALSYELTTRFGIAHGLGVALTLGHVAAFNANVSDADCTHPRGAALVRHRVEQSVRGVFNCDPDHMPARVRELLIELNLPACLRDAGVTEDSLAPMAETVDTVRLSNNPRRVGFQDALRILHNAF
jgi:alcohol dehydrogenase